MHNNIYFDIFNKIKSANNILLVAHDAPDGDALSSICAMIELLEFLNKKYFAYCYDLPAYQFNFLPHIEKITNNKKQFNFDNFDLIITLDCGSLNRTKLTDEINSRRENQFIIEFDHHPKVDDYADIELKNSQAASTTEILYCFLKANKIKINKNMANCILTGILTDTANFLYPSTSEQTIKIASKMLEKGANLPQIMENTWRNKSLVSIKIWGKAMARLKINPKYNFAVTVLTLADVAGNGANEEELEGIAGFISNLHNVKGILLLREQPNNIIKGSLRTSDPKINVSHLAQTLGGGGHAKASGFKIHGRLESVGDRWRII
ncbi:MAG: bifunctional oligoribonuclease/PAP phosphatase NrnA [Patescibacteria group bacterium]|nr:bifunctional oligoribonuclease/PAP phosphatase NrnA [Patescibacteria group bacterium]